MFFGSKKQEKGKPSRSKVFGVDLDSSSKEIPHILETCVVYLDATGLELEGIFRKSGSVVLINQYKERFDNGEPVDFSDVNDPHIVAGLLKMFIRDYPEPLLTFELYDCFLATVAIPDVSTKVLKVKQVIDMLPEANLRIVRYLVSFLCRVTAKSDVNLMTPQNLAIVFAPNLLRPPYEGQEGLGIMMEDTPYANQLLQLFINHYEDLFLDTIKPVAAQKAQPTPPVKAISPAARPRLVSTESPISARLPVPPANAADSQEALRVATDSNPFTSPEPPPKPASRFMNGPPTTSVAPGPRSRPSKTVSEATFSTPNPPPKPSRHSIHPSALNSSNPFEDEDLPTSPEPTANTTLDTVDTNPFATPIAPPKPSRTIHPSKSASSIPVVDTNPFSAPTAPPKLPSKSSSAINPTPQPPVKATYQPSNYNYYPTDTNPPPAKPTPIHSNSHNYYPADTNPFSLPTAPPRPARDLSNSTGAKPPRSTSLNNVPSDSPPAELNPFATPAPPPKPTRSNLNLHKHNKSMPNTASIVAAAAADTNNRRPYSTAALYPPLTQPTTTTPPPPPQLYPVLTQSE